MLLTPSPTSQQREKQVEIEEEEASYESTMIRIDEKLS